MIEDHQSLKINDKKTRLQKTGYRKEVTGLTVNEKVNVQKRYVKQIRMWIYYWEKYGYLRAQQLFVSDYTKDKGYNLNGQPNLVNVLSGKLDFLKMVKSDNDSTFLKLKERFDRLVNTDDLIKNVLDLWENVGIESAMEKYYLGYVKSKYELPRRATLSDFGLDEETIAKLFEEGTSEFKLGDSDN
jgi:RNA-directed DNA polymerase